jgi:hypothetical protein
LCRCSRAPGDFGAFGIATCGCGSNVLCCAVLPDGGLRRQKVHVGFVTELLCINGPP